LTIGGVSIVKPKHMGGIMAYDMNKGVTAWWSQNGGAADVPVTSTDPIFAGVTLPPRPGPSAGGQAQIITTKTLLIYGPNRGGGPGAIYAADKATGKPIGQVATPSKNSAVPMTFLHNGRQYIVYATTIDGFEALTALALPRPCTGRSGCPTARPAAGGAGAAAGGAGGAGAAAAPAGAPPAAGGAAGGRGGGGGGRGGE